jgi:BA14K-like protein
VKVINRGYGDARGATASAPEQRNASDSSGGEPEPDREAIAACERRYSSFRRSDGTYQPYGGGTRQRCPLLR